MQSKNFILNASVIILILAYYGYWASKINGRLAGWLTSKYSFSSKYSHFEIKATLRLASAGIQQAIFFSLLVIYTSIALSDLFPINWNPWLIAVGIILGIGEMALVAFIMNLVMRFAKLYLPDKVPVNNEEWYVISLGGWMRSFRSALKILPPPISMAMILLYIAGEEGIFRGIVISCLSQLGIIGVFISVILFVFIQAFNTPSWNNAIFPMVGATVMGIVHGFLYFSIRDLYPLIIAHCTMFFAAKFRISNKLL